MQSAYKGILHMIPDVAMIAGSFTTEGAGDADVISVKGVASIGHAAGVYTVVLDDKALACYFGSMAALDGANEQLKSFTPSTKTAEFDLGAAKTSTTINLLLFLKTSVVG